MLTTNQHLSFYRRTLLKMACFASLPFYQSFGRLMCLLTFGAMLVVVGHALVAGALVLLVVGKTQPERVIEMVAAGILCQKAGRFSYLTSRTALLVWLLNLPKPLSRKAVSYTRFCLHILRDPKEIIWLCRWYEGLPEIASNAENHLASQSPI
jgi:hypothetical protein